MPDYSKGKLYVIRSFQSNDVYVGSTIETLSRRMAGHRASYKMFLEGKRTYMSSYELLKYPDAYIELLKECPCNSKEQLIRLEGELIRSMDCVNKTVAGRTMTEWKKDNPEKVSTHCKTYYEKHKDKILNINKEYLDKNKDKVSKQRKEYYEKNRKIILQKKKEYYEKISQKLKDKHI